MNATVLIVDDEKEVREVLAKILRNLGYHALLAADGIEAFELYKKRMPDLVLLDLNMPRRNGRTTFEKISTVNPLTPIIFITGSPDDFALATAAYVGALMQKPFDVPLLIQTVQQLIEESVDKRIQRLVYGDRRRIYVTPDNEQTDGADPARAK